MSVLFLSMGLGTFLSCSNDNPQYDDGLSSENPSDTSLENDSGGIAEYSDPWPEEEVTVDPTFSLLYNGALVNHETNISIESAPAGFDHGTPLQFTITNLSATYWPNPKLQKNHMKLPS